MICRIDVIQKIPRGTLAWWCRSLDAAKSILNALGTKNPRIKLTQYDLHGEGRRRSKETAEMPHSLSLLPLRSLYRTPAHLVPLLPYDQYRSQVHDVI